VSSIVYIVLFYASDLEKDDHELFDDAYPMAALIAALTFLLAFRANFSYNRYWEAMSAVHQMHSKWLDVGMELAAFHLQSAAYNQRKPPAFGAHPHLKCLERERERVKEQTLEQLEEELDKMDNLEHSLHSRLSGVFGRNRKAKSKKGLAIKEARQESTHSSIHSSSTAPTPPIQKSINATASHSPPERKTSFFKAHFQHQHHHNTKSHSSYSRTIPTKIGSRRRIANVWEDGKPPLFLQEAAHLLSLTSAVAMSTLRNDLEQAASPLIPFTPGAPWPHVDPDDYGAGVRKDWAHTTHHSWTILRYIMGATRTPAHRTLYNAARPFRVMGGVSDAEIELLQAARGPLAKVALCTMWLQEFMTRESLHGSTGAVAPPILSRLYQFVSDGMIGYNQARKVAYIPFPFPHAQITSLFVLVVVGFMPVVMLSFVTSEVFGFILNLLTVMCFTGLHEVARELENPFQNEPNDVPLNNFQAQFNESLMNMFAGYHPDAYWEVTETKEEKVYPPAHSSILRSDSSVSLLSTSSELQFFQGGPNEQDDADTKDPLSQLGQQDDLIKG
jgi:predicted membrane chloride channel (bestrophin family)